MCGEEGRQALSGSAPSDGWRGKWVLSTHRGPRRGGERKCRGKSGGQEREQALQGRWPRGDWVATEGRAKWYSFNKEEEE